MIYLLIIIFLCLVICSSFSELKKLSKELEKGKKRWDYYESRFVEVLDCDDEKKKRCPLYPEHCFGDNENCNVLIDLERLINMEDDLK